MGRFNVTQDRQNMSRAAAVGVLALAAALSLSACHGKAKVPTGQVVATVDGDEITLREVNAELAAYNFPDEKSRKTAQQQALRAVLNRHILAKAARERGLDKTPDYALMKQRAEDVALVQEMENSISKSVPQATREEASRYVIDHPDLFAERKIFLVDQVRVRQPLDPKISAQLKPMSSLDQVIALFTQNNIQFTRNSDKIDAIGNDPKFIEQIVKLKPTDLFTVPVGQFLVINHVRETQVQPFTGDQAVNYATELLTRQHRQEAVLRDYQSVLQKAQAKITYAKDFTPPKAAAGTNAPTPGATNAP
jgi:EpsD family peptidyl-prolyl cis-trans isomerase